MTLIMLLNLKSVIKSQCLASSVQMDYIVFPILNVQSIIKFCFLFSFSF